MAIAQRFISPSALRLFWVWTVFWWGGVGVCAVLFYVGRIDYVASTKGPLYGVSVWLNAWLLAFVPERKEKSAAKLRLALYHDCLALWMLTYIITNCVWEIPWVLLSRRVFVEVTTLQGVLDETEYMRASPLHMYWWVLSSFSCVDLRTVNLDPTFYSLEMCAFANVVLSAYFFFLVRRQSPLRYLIPIANCGVPVAATFISCFAEVFANNRDMTGGVADTLLALVWTQYQYILFPITSAYFAFHLLVDDIISNSKIGKME